MKEKTEWYEGQGVQTLIAAVLFFGIMYALFSWIGTASQNQADSYNRMTGSNVTAEDMRLNGDRIRIIK